mgnify:CR=1 FL=1
MTERRAVGLSWSEVCGIISEEIEGISGLHIQCKANVVEDSFWDVIADHIFKLLLRQDTDR